MKSTIVKVVLVGIVFAAIVIGIVHLASGNKQSPDAASTQLSTSTTVGAVGATVSATTVPITSSAAPVIQPNSVVPETSNPATTPTTSACAEQLIPTGFTPTVGSVEFSTSLPPDERQAVELAATDLNALASAVFDQPSKLDQVIDQLVVPAQRTDMIYQIPIEATKVATGWGYPSTYSAADQAENNDYVYLFKIDSYQAKNELTVSLYYAEFWQEEVTVQGVPQAVPYMQPAIDTVQMLWQNGQWLYDTDSPATTGLVPPTIPGISCQAIIQTFLPYLKGYSYYVNGNT